VVTRPLSNTACKTSTWAATITPQTWREFGGTQFAPTPRLATPQQQAIIAARLFAAHPDGSDWGADLPGREKSAELAAGLGLGLHENPPQGRATGGPVPTADIPGIDINPVPPGSADEPAKPPEGMGPSSDWVPGVVAPGVGPGPGPGSGVPMPGEPALPKWWQDIIEHGGPGGGHLRAPWWWIGSQWGQVPFDPAHPPLDPKANRFPVPHFDKGGTPGTAGSAVKMPLFTDEDHPAEAYAHNAPFARGAPYRTVLSPEDEKAFQAWAKRSGQADYINNPQADYDLRGYWQEFKPTGRPEFFTDTYKTPYDTTFSYLSKYATPNCPFHWSDGATLIDIRDGSVVFFNPSHYASEPSHQYETGPLAPLDVPGHQTGGPVDDTIIGGDDRAANEPQYSPWRGRNRDPGSQSPPDGGPPIQMSGYGTRWHLEIQHADGSREQLPLTMKRSGGGVTQWSAGRRGLRPGDEIQLVKHRR
jgi:hypothetical protein